MGEPPARGPPLRSDAVIVACSDRDAEEIHRIVNDAARAYHGVIPAHAWHEPYMPLDELRAEMSAGVRFSAFVDAGRPVGVMGLQDVRDATLIRHAYVLPGRQRSGIGSALLEELRGRAGGRLMVGTWRDAAWAIAFYERNGFRLLPDDEAQEMLRAYWDVPPSQAAESVVLAGQ